ncbi:MAG: alpha/beta hydrolase, partial [Sphingobium sp.]
MNRGLARRELLNAMAGILLTAGFADKLLAATPTRFASRRIAVTVSGAGQDVILIPGLASGPSIWNAALAAVPGYRYHRIQVRGFAGLAADLNASGPLLKPIVDEISRYVRETGLGTPALVGHSMGGTLAMMLALRGSPVARRVMVIDMLPDGSAMLGGTSAGMGYLAQQLNGYFTQTKAGREMLADMVHGTPGGQDSDPHVISQSLAELAQTDLGPMLARLSCPLDVIYALPADGRLRATQADRYRSAYTAARTARLTGIGPSGHMVMLDQPQKFAAALQLFL